MILQSALFLAVVVERLVEWVFGTAFDKIEKLKPFRWTLMYVAGVLGIVASLQFDLDLLTLSGLAPSLLGQVLTGVLIGGGANLLHDLFEGSLFQLFVRPSN